jgi:hypothetical protein
MLLPEEKAGQTSLSLYIAAKKLYVCVIVIIIAKKVNHIQSDLFIAAICWVYK